MHDTLVYTVRTGILYYVMTTYSYYTTVPHPYVLLMVVRIIPTYNHHSPQMESEN